LNHGNAQNFDSSVPLISNDSGSLHFDFIRRTNVRTQPPSRNSPPPHSQGKDREIAEAVASY
jgi:hypothetical protein